MQQVKISTADGHTLAGLLFEPQGAPKAACVINAATGVPKEFYAKFAAWMAAERNVAVLVYDYRGFGKSSSAPQATMADWGIKDASAALDFMIAKYPEAEKWALGHSLGGLFLNGLEQSGKLTRAFTVASGANYWLRHPVSYMPAAAAFWWVVGPLLIAIKGYLPGKAAGLGADLPKDVYWQWRRWCLSKEFYNADKGKLPAFTYKNLPSLRMIAMTDDKMITPAMVRDLERFYGGSKIERREIKPADAGAKSLGHTNIFREQNKKAWPLIID